MTCRELQLKYPSKSFGEIDRNKVDGDKQVNIKREYDLVYPDDYERDADKEGGQVMNDYLALEVIDKGWEIYLEHSCDEWVIGTLKEAKIFQDNLRQAIKFCEKNK